MRYDFITKHRPRRDAKLPYAIPINKIKAMINSWFQVLIFLIRLLVLFLQEPSSKSSYDEYLSTKQKKGGGFENNRKGNLCNFCGRHHSYFMSRITERNIAIVLNSVEQSSPLIYKVATRRVIINAWGRKLAEFGVEKLLIGDGTLCFSEI